MALVSTTAALLVSIFLAGGWVFDTLWRPLLFDIYDCTHPLYQVRILSYDPFIAHLENFITVAESKHLKGLALPTLKRSRVRTLDNGKVESDGRTSSTAHLPGSDRVVQCLAQRASVLQGHLPTKEINVQATVYEKGQYYRPHYDAGIDTPNGTMGAPNNGFTFRTSTIFGILDADCERCGTEFPNVHINVSEVNSEMCRLIECADDVSTLTAKAIKGSAMFWRNRHNNGSVDPRLLHAGLPLESGFKHGLNIWTSVREK